jgi:hypothetical protein
MTDARNLKDAHGRAFPFPDEPGAPNLDAQTQEDLMTFWAIAHAHPVTVARQLFPERPQGYVSATYTLSAYACNKATAMRCRLRGDIPAAGVYEKACEMCYERLPAWARW